MGEMAIEDKDKKTVRSVYRSSAANRREFFRVIFHALLKGSMQVVGVNGKSVDMNSTPVLIEDMGLGGMCFSSNIDLPAHPGLVLQVNFALADQEFVSLGKIKRRQDEGGLYTYGLEFIMKEEARQELFVALTKLQVKMRTDPLDKNYSWHEGDKRAFFDV
ncbi:PilZ domain-containing protein [Alteribacter natronophilus]|uniref:PilZ domain-containing protein n=1 Tax=Alteribacter natronophilus TaxID=2583810 RepID=UPI00110D7647|nr:PilZ domain-containing protein [Alteribacter natronophilus]TMW72971.1 PilZ domain-containing protein [Alteribacter natronophilus]